MGLSPRPGGPSQRGERQKMRQRGMAGLYDDAFVERLRQGALGLAPKWGLGPETDVRLLTLSENATYKRPWDTTSKEAYSLEVDLAFSLNSSASPSSKNLVSAYLSRTGSGYFAESS